MISQCWQRTVVELDRVVVLEADLKGVLVARAVLVGAIPAKEDRALTAPVVRVALTDKVSPHTVDRVARCLLKWTTIAAEVGRRTERHKAIGRHPCTGEGLTPVGELKAQIDLRCVVVAKLQRCHRSRATRNLRCDLNRLVGLSGQRGR